MVNVEVKEFKIQIKGKAYTFRLDFEALLKFNEKYDNAMMVFNDFLSGKNIYDCIVKILACACKEKDWTEKDLRKNLSFDFKTMKLMDEITFALVEGILNDEEGNENESGKN